MIFSWLGLRALHRIDLTRERKHLRYSSWRPWAPREQASANILALPRRFPGPWMKSRISHRIEEDTMAKFHFNANNYSLLLSCQKQYRGIWGVSRGLGGSTLKSLSEEILSCNCKKHTILRWRIIQRCHKKNNRYNVTRLEKLERAFLHLRLAIMHRMEWDRLMHMSPLDLSPLALDILYPLVCFDFIAIPRVNSLNGTS